MIDSIPALATGVLLGTWLLFSLVDLMHTLIRIPSLGHFLLVLSVKHTKYILLRIELEQQYKRHG